MMKIQFGISPEASPNEGWTTGLTKAQVMAYVKIWCDNVSNSGQECIIETNEAGGGDHPTYDILKDNNQ